MLPEIFVGGTTPSRTALFGGSSSGTHAYPSWRFDSDHGAKPVLLPPSLWAVAGDFGARVLRLAIQPHARGEDLSVSLWRAELEVWQRPPWACAQGPQGWH